MAEIMRCDCCGKTYGKFDDFHYKFCVSPYCSSFDIMNCNTSTRSYDLCPKCSEKVLSFIKKLKEEER